MRRSESRHSRIGHSVDLAWRLSVAGLTPRRLVGQGLRLIGTALAFGAALCSQSRGWLLQLVLLGACVTAGNLRFGNGIAAGTDLRSPDGFDCSRRLCRGSVGFADCRATVIDRLLSRLTEDTRSDHTTSSLHKWIRVTFCGKGPHASMIESIRVSVLSLNGFDHGCMRSLPTKRSPDPLCKELVVLVGARVFGQSRKEACR